MASLAINAAGGVRQEYDRLGRLSTILGASIEYVDMSLPATVRGFSVVEQAWEQLRVIVSRPPRNLVGSLRDVLRPLLQESTFASSPTHSLGILAPSAVEHWQDQLLLRAERILATAILQSSARKRDIYRLPQLEPGSPWQPLVVHRPSISPLIVRVRSDAAANVAGWFPSEVHWSAVFPERVRRLRRWPLEGFLESDQDTAIRQRDWLLGESPEWGDYRAYNWNRALEMKAGMLWLAQLVIASRSVDSESQDLQAYEYPVGALTRLTGWDWALFAVSHRGQVRSRFPLIPDYLRSVAHQFGLGNRDDRRNAAIVFSREPVESPTAIDVYQFKATGFCGGRRIVQLAGQEAVPPTSVDADPLDAERFADLYARAHCEAGALISANDMGNLLLGRGRRTRVLNATARRLAAAFAAESIVVWRRLSPDGAFRPLLAFRRPDLGDGAPIGEGPERFIDQAKLINAVTNFPPTKHPLGPEWRGSVRADATAVHIDTMSLFPVWAGDTLFGIIEIGDEVPGRDASWRSLMQPLFDRLEAILPHVGALEHRDLEARRSVRHQIRPALNSLANNSAHIIDLARGNRNAAMRRELHARAGINDQIIGDMREFLEGLTPGLNGPARMQSDDPVLDFARKSLRLPVTLPTELQSQIATAFDGVRPILEDRGLKLALPTDGDVVNVRAPAQTLQIILSNLASNAAKYATKNSLIDVSLGRSGRNALIIEFSNFGERMEDDERNLIFHRSFRSYSAEKSAVPGEGIGLFHVKGVVALLGGQVHYTVSPAGTRSQARHTVRIVLPASLVEGDEGGTAPV